MARGVVKHVRDSGKVSKSAMERFGYSNNSGGRVAALMESYV